MTSASAAREELRAYFSRLNETIGGAIVSDLDDDLRVSLRTAEQRAALTQWFDPGELWHQIAMPAALQPTPEWLGALRRSCLVDMSDPTRWRLLDDERSRLLAELQASGHLTELVERVARSTSADAPRLILDILRRQFDLEQASSTDLLRAAEIVDWLESAQVPGELPSQELIGAILELRARDAELGQLAGDVIGREEELRLLTSFLRHAWRSTATGPLPVMKLEGIGGIGKSTMAAHLVCHGLPPESEDPIIAWVDYDKLRIHPEDVGSVVAELSRQLSWALPERAQALRAARLLLRQTTDVDGLVSSDPDDLEEFDELETGASIDTLSEALSGHHRGRIERPVLIVLDTFEQVERLPGKVADLIDMLIRLRKRALPRLAVLVCGRSVFARGFGSAEVDCHDLPFTGLSRAASHKLLVGRAGLDPQAAARFLAAFDDLIEGRDEKRFRSRVGIPMLLMLIGRLTREKRIDLGTDDLAAIREAADGEMATAYIYGRVLTQVPEELRALAHPGLVLSEVSAQSIAEVIWPVVRPQAPRLESWEAERLFERLSRETWLVEPVIGAKPARVRHRPDLRRAMLTKMVADTEPGARDRLLRLHRRARDWHRAMARRRPVDRDLHYHRSATVYHALQLAALTGRSTGLSLAAIRRARDEIIFQTEDFPLAYRPVLRGLLGDELSSAELDRLDPSLRVALITDLARNHLERSDPDTALAFMSSLSPSDREITPTIARLMLKLFLKTGRWSSARPLIEPLISRPFAPAFPIGARAVRLDTVLAAHVVRYDDVLDEVVGTGQILPGTSGAARQRYQVIEALLAQLRLPGAQRRDALLARLQGFVAGLPSRRPLLEDLRLVRIYGTLLREADPGRRNLSMFQASLRRGAHPVGVITLQEMAGELLPQRSMAQWVSACRAAERRIEREGLPQPHLRLATIFEEFHQPLGNALTASMRDKESAYRIASLAWQLTDTRPHDLRPSTFAEMSADPAARRLACPVLIAFLDRSGVLAPFLAELPGVLPLDEDLEMVRLVTLRWTEAFGGAR